ncbi:MAG: glycosyltransferase family 1 protein [Microgenomates group bacterium]
MKIAIVSGTTKSADSVRGIGVHNSSLFKAFSKLRNKDYKIPEVGKNDDLSEFDVVHFTSFRPFFISLPFFKPKNTKFVLTIHDMHPLIYPKYFAPGLKGGIRLLINNFLIWKNVDRIITISETSKKDICRFMGVDPKKVDVVYLAPKPAHHPLKAGKWVKEIKDKYKLPEKFVFYLGDVNYNKNIPTLVKACDKAGIKLVIVGKQAKEIKENKHGFGVLLGPMDYLRSFFEISHPEIGHYKSLKGDFNNNEVFCLGFVEDNDVNKIMNLALCTVQPSYYEGFGLSVIHGFASGSPVISSRAQALVEVGEDACLYFDPNSVDDLVEKLKILMTDNKQRNKYIKRGYEQVKKYSWDKAAYETLEVYRKA